MATEQSVRDALKGVKDPELGRSLIDLDMVRDVKVDEGRVAVTLALTTMGCPLKDRITNDVRQAILALPGVSDVAVEMVAMTPEERAKAFDQAGAEEKQPSLAKQLNHVKQVVAVMSGKGGVGKSLVTGLLAVALARDGKKVGILDADVTGPSIPKMFGLRQRPQGGPFGLFPVLSRMGIEVISINLLLEREDDAVIWRGPLIGNVIKQFWEDVIWGDIDYLLIDLPPGTADAPLTVMQSIPVQGAVVVATPQGLVGMVVRKAVRMAEQMNVSILGIVENMSYFVCPDTGKQHEIFGPSRGEKLARIAGAPLLGRLPIDPEAARLCDAGSIEDYESDAYRSLARSFTNASESLSKVKTAAEGN